MIYVSFLFRNFNREIFTRRPEFCLLYEKMQKTCLGWKRDALINKYPDLCQVVEEVTNSDNRICSIANSTGSNLLDSMSLKLNGSILKLRDELFIYARDNLAVVNIYIKDATVTKIRRDQKVGKFNQASEAKLYSILFSGSYHLVHCKLWWDFRPLYGLFSHHHL